MSKVIEGYWSYDKALTEYDFKDWLIKKGADLIIVEHERFNQSGILDYLLSRANLDYNKEPRVQMHDDFIEITCLGDNSRVMFYVDGGEIKVSAIHTEKDFNVRRVYYISVGKDKENLEINEGYVYMNRDDLRIQGRRVQRSYNSAGIEMKHEIKEKEDFSIFGFGPHMSIDKINIDKINKVRYELLMPRSYQSSESLRCQKDFLKRFECKSAYSLVNSMFSFYDPDYYERAQRTQYDVANVYIKDKRSRFYPDKKDIEYSGYMPIDNRYLVDMGLQYGGLGTFYSMSDSFYEAPEIPAKTEEQIKTEIANTSATQKQKAALYDFATFRKRTEFSYSYLDDPKYSNINGKGK